MCVTESCLAFCCTVYAIKTRLEENCGPFAVFLRNCWHEDKLCKKWETACHGALYNIKTGDSQIIKILAYIIIFFICKGRPLYLDFCPITPIKHGEPLNMSVLLIKPKEQRQTPILSEVSLVVKAIVSEQFILMTICFKERLFEKFTHYVLI